MYYCYKHLHIILLYLNIIIFNVYYIILKNRLEIYFHEEKNRLIT